MLGPVQVLVVSVPDEDRARHVMGSVAALQGEGPVGCLDAFEVEVTEEGELLISGLDPIVPPRSLPLFAEPADDLAEVSSVVGMWHIGEVVPRGSRAVVALLEHRWAIGLRDSMVVAGAALVHETWLDQDDRATLDGLLAEGV
jgi:hypothetical protein